ncbi:MAG TPA: hypothetical protein VJU87_05605 [Gemmatimonadaceae bacterium]|nr:hypothetical protein [Gemmatimonadaceae bacterium]
MKSSRIFAAALVALVSGALACTSDVISSPAGSRLSPGPATFGAVDENESATYTWIIGHDFTQASNGDQIELRGRGPLGIHPKSASGGGTFTHRNASGMVLGSGAWTVTELLSFQSYGPPSPGFPVPNASAGKAQFRVVFTPAGTTLELPGIMDVECILPGSAAPGGTIEGTRVVVPSVANFNKPVSGGTLFIRTS